jgi:mono/diheme cytochrome c family protein
MLPRRLTTLAVLAVLALPSAFACTATSGASDDTVEEGEEDAIARVDEDGVRHLNQGWTSEDEASWLHLSDGSGIVPLPWLLALEKPASDEMFLDPKEMAQFGFLPAKRSTANPYGLPAGLAPQRRPFGPLPMVGSNCAGCHEAELSYRGVKLRVNGGQGRGMLAAWGAAVFTALGATLKTLETSDASKFDRFAARVFEATRQAETFQGPDGPTRKQTATAQLVAGLQKTLAIVQTSAQHDAMHGISSAGWGPYRQDALQKGGNQLAAKLAPDLRNNVPTVAPVSLPPLWGTNEFDWVQYNASIRQPLARNVLSVLARNSDLVTVATPERALFDSSVELDSLVKAERLVQKLRAPKWPSEVLGKIDRAKASRGRSIYVAKCDGCHGAPKGPDGFRNLSLLPLATIGTDPNQAEMWANRTFDMNGVAGRNVVSSSEFLKTVTDGVIARNAGQVSSADLADTDKGRPNDVRAPLAYSARPLNGIWATAPYLHNGSVPSLYELLKPADERPKRFFVGSSELDPVNVGLESGPGEGRFELDTSLSGNHNTGHTGEQFGTTLDETDRWALVEYLKSL